MEQSLIYALVILAVALVILIVVLVRRHERRRTAALDALARQRAWSFAQGPVVDIATDLGDFPLFDRGHGRRVSNRITGAESGFDFELFDYRYVVGSGQHASSHRQSVVILSSDRLDLPAFELRPESLVHKIGERLGYQDIDFAAHPDFSASYLLRGEHEGRVRQCFNSSLRRYFEGASGWSIESDGHGLLIYRHRHRCRPDQAPGLIGQSLEIGRLFCDQHASI